MGQDHLFTILSHNIGRFISFEDRCICIQTHKCFENIHDTYEYQNWTLKESNIIPKKYKYVKKYKPRLKKFKSIHIKSRALNMLFNHDLSKLKNCKRIICSIEDEFTYKLNDIMTIAYDSYFITMNIKSRDHIMQYHSCTCLEYIFQIFISTCSYYRWFDW